MKHFFTIVLSMLVVAMSLTGCREELDIKNMDGTAELDLGLALPVGTMNATLGGILGDSLLNGKLFFDGNGILTYVDTFSIHREFHKIDLSRYISNVSKDFKCLEKVPGGVIVGDGVTQVMLPFTISLELKGINDPDSLNNERFDSIIVSQSQFISRVSVTDMDLQWSWIDHVDMALGEAVSRKEGNVVTLYKRGDGYDFGQDMPLNISEYSINLMKDRKAEPGINNINNKLDFEIQFYFTIPAGQVVYITPNSAFNYSLSVKFIDFDAVWGMFSRSNAMIDEDTIRIQDEWPKWADIKKIKVPFSDPYINMIVTTQVAGHLRLNGNYLFTMNEAGQEEFAYFDRDRTKKSFAHIYSDSEIIPLDSPLDTQSTTKIAFSKADQEGQIDHLLAIRPDYIAYSFDIDFDSKDRYPQARLTNNTNLYVDAALHLPMRYNPGAELSYADTIKDLDLSKYSLDTLMSELKIVDSVKATNLQLYLTLQNSIPMQIKGHVRFLDQDMNPVMVETPNGKVEFKISADDTLRVDAPRCDFAGGKLVEQEMGKSQYVVSFNKEQWRSVQQIRHIIYDATMDDAPLRELGNAHLDRYSDDLGRIHKDAQLKIKIGVTANVGATFDLNQLINNKK